MSATRSGRPLHKALVSNNGRDPLVLGVTGWGCRADGGMWPGFVRAQAEAETGHRTTVVDLLWPAGRADSIFGTAIRGLGQVIEGVDAESIVLVGHSMGATVVGGWQTRYRDPRVKGVVLIAPALRPLPLGEIAKLAVPTSALMLPPPLSSPMSARLASHWSQHHGNYRPEDMAPLLSQAWRLNRELWWWSRPELIPGAVLSILLRDDSVCPARRARRLLAGDSGTREILRLPGEHTPLGPDAQRVSEAVGEFARRVAGR
jgi:pimeloyl-ACP methyl ester carboxylesterase